MAISGHRCEANLWNYIGSPSNEQIRACSDILSDRLSGRPHQQSQRPCFTALSSRASFMFQWIRLSFIHKTQALSSLFFSIVVKKNLACFYEPLFSRISRNISLSDSVQETKKTLCKSVKFELPNSISVCKLFQFVNPDGMNFLTAPVSFNQPDYLNHSNKNLDRLF